MGFRQLGIPKKNLKEIENACETMYLESRKLQGTVEQQDLYLNELIEVFIKKAFEKAISKDYDINKDKIESAIEVREKFLLETKKLMNKRRKRFKKELSLLSLKKIQGESKMLLRYEVANNTLEEKEPEFEFVNNCLKQMDAET